MLRFFPQQEDRHVAREIKRTCVRFLLGCAMVVAFVTPLAAQDFAVRSGFNVNPDQFSVGGQYEFGPVAKQLWLQPSVDLGFGDGSKLVAMNFDVVYRRSLDRRSVWTGFAGGGPALNMYRVDGATNTEAGASVLGGVIHRSGLFTELRVGFLESPQVRFGAGYVFYRGKTSTAKPPVRRR
jgi:hypothetical protein